MAEMMNDWDLEFDARFDHWEEDMSWLDDDLDADLDFSECEG